MDAILRAVDGAGISRADVRTAMLSVQPRYDYRDGRAPVLTGYEIANIVEVSVRDLAVLGDVIDATLAAGATSMDALTFRLADPVPSERDARRQAMAEARSRADVLAEAAGLTIVGVSDILEGRATAASRPDRQGGTHGAGRRCADPGRGRHARGDGHGQRHVSRDLNAEGQAPSTAICSNCPPDRSVA